MSMHLTLSLRRSMCSCRENGQRALSIGASSIASKNPPGCPRRDAAADRDPLVLTGTPVAPPVRLLVIVGSSVDDLSSTIEWVPASDARHRRWRSLRHDLGRARTLIGALRVVTRRPVGELAAGRVLGHVEPAAERTARVGGGRGRPLEIDDEPVRALQQRAVARRSRIDPNTRPPTTDRSRRNIRRWRSRTRRAGRSGCL